MLEIIGVALISAIVGFFGTLVILTLLDGGGRK